MRRVRQNLQFSPVTREFHRAGRSLRGLGSALAYRTIGFLRARSFVLQLARAQRAMRKKPFATSFACSEPLGERCFRCFARLGFGGRARLRLVTAQRRAGCEL